MKFVALVSTLSMTASSVWASGYVLAKEAPSLRPRTSFQGGWPIEANSCPSNTTSCDDGSCCPGSTNCYTDGLAGVAVCCPTTSDCYQTANAVPICADPSWTLYIGNYNYFCCSTGQIGILPDPSDDPGSGLCVEDGTNVASTALATLYTAASGAGHTGTPQGSPTASTPMTVTAGGAGGVAASALAKFTATSSTTATTVPKKNDSAKSSSFSIMGIIFGFLLVPFGI